jgi:hypothetical protein
MQRLLAESSTLEASEAANDDATPAPPQSIHQVRPGPDLQPTSAMRTLPPPLPTSATRTLPPPLPLPPQSCPPPPPPPQRSRTAAVLGEHLVLYFGDERLVIDRHPYVIGRSATMADLIIEDSQVSRRHAVIEQTTAGWEITDLGSTNGIVINGEVVRHAVLRAGTVMSIGPMAFCVASPD